ncbi:hypothetical protein NDU88_005416 [Pleurodeles waltl]|uniref:Uncharacterized protein n=1 Tax=Pleurodeles waltl TaxID=8319 RepID=A0AAV7PNJ9_PLEWA|nr:hypothetical protein NDU88_005416 [Pleurodeles waltl]
MARRPSLSEIEPEDIKQIGFILSSEGEEVTKALFYSECIRRMVLQAEAELRKEGIRLVQQKTDHRIISSFSEMNGKLRPRRLCFTEAPTRSVGADVGERREPVEVRMPYRHFMKCTFLSTREKND